MATYFVPTGTKKCGNFDACPPDTVCLRPLLYKDPALCVHSKWNLDKDLINGPAASHNWLLLIILGVLIGVFLLELGNVTLHLWAWCRKPLESRTYELTTMPRRD